MSFLPHRCWCARCGCRCCSCEELLADHKGNWPKPAAGAAGEDDPLHAATSAGTAAANSVNTLPELDRRARLALAASAVMTMRFLFPALAKKPRLPLMWKSLNLRFQALPQEIATRHSSNAPFISWRRVWRADRFCQGCHRAFGRTPVACNGLMHRLRRREHSGKSGIPDLLKKLASLTEPTPPRQ